ncbi:MAG: NAD(P)-dependent oxidoreductase [Lachnospiraceae bacterium]|nr:NAD(P)-dependent oxidoreductase [Lachnospiraceae bacterium]
MDRNVIITGATGFIGRYLTEELLRNGYQVYAVVRNPEKLKQFHKYSGLHFIVKDLADLCADDMPDVEYKTFYHLGWGGVNREEIDKESVHEISLHNSIKCLEIAHKLGCDCFISTGSKAEYGIQDHAQEENALCKPESAYGKAKLSFYEYAHAYCKTVGMQFYHARLFSVIGVGDHPWSLVSTACRKFAAGEEMHFGPCTQLWNFTAVEDAVKGLRLLAECEPMSDDHGIYNIAGKDTRILRDFVNEIHRICNSQSVMCFSQEPMNGDFMNPSTERIRTLTGWKEDYTFEESIRRILKANGDKETT